MTDEQLKAIIDGIFIPGEVTWDDYGNEFRKLAAFIESAVLAELAKQEPVAWIDKDLCILHEDERETNIATLERMGWKPLYEGFHIKQSEKLDTAPVVQPDDIRDAMRYRWLRAQHWGDSNLCVVKDPKDAVKLGRCCPSGGWLDAAIDDAMKERK